VAKRNYRAGGDGGRAHEACYAEGTNTFAESARLWRMSDRRSGSDPGL